METIKDWKDKWIKTNGKTDDLEVLIRYNNENEDIYEGSFVDIPKDLEEKKVINYSKILTSTISKRIGAYILKIG